MKNSPFRSAGPAVVFVAESRFSPPLIRSFSTRQGGIMRATSKRLLLIGLCLLALCGWGLWSSVSFRPSFHARLDSVPRAERQAYARRFLQQSTQLRNDIANEPRWEAKFSDQEVNSWLSEDLVAHFADQIPPGVADPRIAFEKGSVIFAFRFDYGAMKTYISVHTHARVVEDNVLAVRIDAIRAGVLPISAEQVLEKIADHARARGLDVRWERENNRPLALIRYTPHPGRADVVLEKLAVGDGVIRLAGRSDRSRGVVRTPTLPRRRVLQSTFPLKRNNQTSGASTAPGVSVNPVGFFQNRAEPTSFAPHKRASNESSDRDDGS
jgi:hypothetical protein